MGELIDATGVRPGFACCQCMRTWPKTIDDLGNLHAAAFGSAFGPGSSCILQAYLTLDGDRRYDGRLFQKGNFTISLSSQMTGSAFNLACLLGPGELQALVTISWLGRCLKLVARLL